MSREPLAACVCPSRPCPVHAPGMTDLMVSPEAIDAALASPEWAVREYEDLRDDYLIAVRVADASVALLDHDDKCRDFRCLMRDGCDVRVRLMEALNELTNDYAEARKGV